MASDITNKWLRDRFEARGQRGDVSNVSVLRTINASSGLIYFINALQGGARRSLVLKVYHRDQFDAGINESLLYQSFVGGYRPVPAPTCYDVYCDVAETYCHVLTSDLTPTHRMCDRERLAIDADAVVTGLARMHADWWDAKAIFGDVMRVPQAGTVSFIQATSRAAIVPKALWVIETLIPAFYDRFRDVVPRDWRDLQEAAAASWPDLLGDRLEGRRDLTLLHGDTNWENIFLGRAPDVPVRFIDWEAFKSGPPAYDVAYWLISARNVHQRRTLEPWVLDRYLDALAEFGGTTYSREALLADYQLSTVANVFVSLAWCRLHAVRDAMAAFFDWDGQSLVT